jgi:hypothetical protein
LTFLLFYETIGQLLDSYSIGMPHRLDFRSFHTDMLDMNQETWLARGEFRRLCILRLASFLYMSIISIAPSSRLSRPEASEWASSISHSKIPVVWKPNQRISERHARWYRVSYRLLRHGTRVGSEGSVILPRDCSALAGAVCFRALFWPQLWSQNPRIWRMDQMEVHEVIRSKTSRNSVTRTHILVHHDEIGSVIYRSAGIKFTKLNITHK